LLELRPIYPKKNIQQEIDGFVTRINLLDNTKILQDTHINTLIKQAEDNEDRQKLIENLTMLYNDLNKIVQSDSKTFLSKMKLL